MSALADASTMPDWPVWVWFVLGVWALLWVFLRVYVAKRQHGHFFMRDGELWRCQFCRATRDSSGRPL